MAKKRGRAADDKGKGKRQGKDAKTHKDPKAKKDKGKGNAASDSASRPRTATNPRPDPTATTSTGTSTPPVSSALDDAGRPAAPTVNAPVQVDIAADLRPDAPIGQMLRVGRGFRLADVDPAGTPGFDGGKELGAEALAAYATEIGEWQERLFAETKAGGSRALLVVVQGMDTSGKGGIMRHVVSVIDPVGVRATAFKAPTEEERAHDFLWRIRNALPRPGQIGVFDRSHYEDVLIVKVRQLIPAADVAKRYALINAFERAVARSGTQLVKVMLHVSREEQKARLLERLERPDKHYKYNPGDVDERARWDEYMAAYQVALTRCSTVAAPWHVVPADRKWYARYAVQQLVLEKLREMNPQFPVMGFDVDAEKARLAAT
ncbi:MAG: PPK2 family polyphosphate kinase [Dermatophilaceae bacterium]